MKGYVFIVVICVIFVLEFISVSVSEITCSTNCRAAVDADTPTCNLTTGACIYGCIDRFTGDTCNISCGENCLNCSILSDSIQTACYQCENSFYHKDNISCLPCGSRCLTNASSSLPVCRQTDGRCEFGCEPTYYGVLCNIQCSATCKDRQCDRDTGQCISGCVIESISGNLCNKACNSGCLGRNCEQNGTCKHGCEAEFWGSSCNSTCSFNCQISTEPVNRSCDQNNGTCLYGCGNGLYGSVCEITCPDNCLGNICEQNGTCKDGCVTYFWGLTCNSTCSSGCQDLADSNNRACDADDGACLFGCVDDRWGPRCELSCPENCVTNNCSDVLGNCTEGCKPGFYGSHCNESCSTYCVDNVCDRMTGMCQCEEGISGTLCSGSNDPVQEESEGGTNILALVFIILAIIVVLIFIVFFSYLVRRE